MTVGERRLRALLLSLVVCPGAGQLVLGRRARGVVMMALALGATAALGGFLLWSTWVELVGGMSLDDPFPVPRAVAGALARHPLPFAVGLAAVAGVWLWSAADAWCAAR